MPDLSSPKLATKQTIEPGRDEGLIDALQTELNGAAEKVSIDMNSGGDFLAPPIQKTPEISIDSDVSNLRDIAKGIDKLNYHIS